MNVKNVVKDCLAIYQKQTEEKIRQSFFIFGEKGTLREACEYALTTGGRRFRPALVFMVADALGNSLDASDAALSVEYFHTASLIADDLPCMDDDDERRNKPSLHKAFGEATALLASYTLIAAGNACIASCAQSLVQSGHPAISNGYQVGILALEHAARSTGAQGATGGQFLDIFPPTLTLESLREIIYKKTVSLFEIAFLFGWLFGGGDIKKIEQVKQVALHFGMAFQIADDLSDVTQDAINERAVNMVGILGIEKAREVFRNEIAGYRQSLKTLGIDSQQLLGLALYLEELVN